MRKHTRHYIGVFASSADYRFVLFVDVCIKCLGPSPLVWGFWKSPKWLHRRGFHVVRNKPSPYFTPFSPSSCNAPRQFTLFLDLRSLMVGVTPVSWFISYVSFGSCLPTNSVYHSWFRPLFQESNEGVKQGLGVLFCVLATRRSINFISKFWCFADRASQRNLSN